MRIQQLEIDRFGVWEDVTLPFDEKGVTVLYGPNEAGKSTLMRFIRGVLYGFQRQDETTGGPRPKPVECSGTLRLVHEGNNYRLRRTSQPGTRGKLEINGRVVDHNDSLLTELTGGASEELFTNVFAIGLNELQQLATLDADDVSQHIYGLSLGPEGDQIFRAQSAFMDRERQLIGHDGQPGELRSLLKDLEHIDKELARADQPTSRHSSLLGNIAKLDDGIDERKRRQAQIQHDLRGHQFLMRAWEPWKKERELRRELDRLPSDDVDKETLSKLDELELELADTDEKRKLLIEEAKRIQKQAEEITTRPELEQHMCAIQNLSEKSKEMQALERGVDTRKHGLDPRDSQLQSMLAKLDGHWDIKRLSKTDVSPAGMARLMKHADRYRSRMRNRSRTVKKYKKQTASLKSQQQFYKTTARDFDLADIPETRKQLEQRLHDLEELRQLKFRELHLQKTAELLTQDRGTRAVGKELPEFFWVVLWMFVFGGLILFGAGFYEAFVRDYAGVAGRNAAWLIGSIYTLMGIAALGTCWTMKQHFSTQEFRLNDLGTEREGVDRELYRIHEAIERINRKEAVRTPLSGASRLINETETLNEEAAIPRIRQQLLDLSELERDSTSTDRLRRSLSKMRQSLQDKQKDVSDARREWTEALRNFGLAETLNVDQAFEQCQLVAEAKRYQDDWNARYNNEEQQQREIEKFYRDVEALGEKIEGRGYHVRDHHKSLEDWDAELSLLGERRRERAQLKQTSKDKRREAGRHVERIDILRQQREVLLTRLGVAERGEIIAKLAAIDERKSLQHKIDQVRGEIRKLAESEPDFAITEDLFTSFEVTDTRQSVDALKSELAQIERSLQDDFENVGKYKQELQLIEGDRSVTSLRFDREQVVDAIQDLTSKWASTRLADKVVGRLRERIEQERQPDTLQAASEYLRQLTCDKYVNIWTPLGEKVILVNDEKGESLRVEHLSSGTREQVFLALRMAMIRGFAKDGIELPLVLDDVTVNFDQIRTEAAVETLLDVADEGQQIMLFTCHLHLAHIFENQGVDPVWLPDQRAEMLHG